MEGNIAPSFFVSNFFLFGNLALCFVFAKRLSGSGQAL
jgi:hypothetical protein